MSILEVTGLTHTFGDKKLFDNTGMQFSRGDKMGLTGLNGVGKSTFLGMLTGELLPDNGYIKWNPRVKVGYLNQQVEIPAGTDVLTYLRGAYRELFEAQRELESLDAQIAACKDQSRLETLLRRAGDRQELLDARNFYAVESEIEKAAAGLGITAFGLDKPVAELSGGQREKVMLARLLLEAPDVLLLDEPTNFLDAPHIEWLAKYLQAFKGSFIVVSHDFQFLNRVINCICDIEFGVMSKYNGSYESFLRQKEAKREGFLKNYQSQQKEIAKLEDYVAKNKVRASTAKQAKSRQKKLDKIQVIEKPSEALKPDFLFRFTPARGKTTLWVNDLAVGYSEQILPEINLMVQAGEKVAVTGFNGIGKSTFLKTICGIIPALGGSYKYAENCVIGYYAQEPDWPDPSETPLSFLKNRYPKLIDKQIRAALSRCALKSEQVMRPLSSLSGGEQAKVRICQLILKPFSLLILDEPTSHLDVNAIQQLHTAIRHFEGSVLFVSHSPEFCKTTADRVMDMEKLFD